MAPTEEEEDFLQEKKTLLKYVTKALKRSQKQLLQREQTLLDCQNWKSVEHEGLLLKANLFRLKKGMSQITVKDWEQEDNERILNLDTTIEPKDQAIKFFKKSKKLRKGLPHAERLLQLTKDDVLLKEKQLFTLNNISSSEDLALYCTTFNINVPSKTANIPTKKTPPPPPKPFHEYISESGLHIWVGKNAKCNDQLSFRYAKGSDWWLHARDYPGSHVVIRCAKGNTPDPEALNDAAELALRYSKACQNKEGEVTVSQVKHLTRLPNCPGKVQLSKHQVIYIRLDEARWLRLKSKIGSKEPENRQNFKL